MAITKNAWVRYKILDKCLSNTGRKYTFEDLKEEIDQALSEIDSDTAGISIRQLRKDLQFLQSEQGYNAPVELIIEGRQRYYRYSERFSIHQNNLNETESKHLQQAISTLRNFEGRPDFEWLNELGPILENKYGEYDQKSIIGYDSNIDYVGSHLIPELFSAITNKRVLKIGYKDFKGDVFSNIFHPYYLKQYNNRWFLFGRHEEKDHNQWNLPLDRIESIEEINQTCKKDSTDWDDFFYDIIGVHRGFGDPQEIVMEFEAKTANYVKTKPLHATQKMTLLENGNSKVSIKVVPNYELEALILSFGENVKIISPESLVEKINSRIYKLVKKLNNNNYFQNVFEK